MPDMMASQAQLEMRSPTLSVVIPIYNEVDNINPLYRELTSILVRMELEYEIILIDDGSTDGSFDVLQEIHATDRHVKVIQFRRNFGQTAAFAAGFDYASGELIVTLDADGQNNPADIPQLFETLRQGDYDFVTGWRINRKEPFLRRVLSAAANRVISQSTGVSVHDRGCSLKLFKSELVKNLRLYGQLHRFIPELASAIGVRVAEIPVQDRERVHGHSKYGAWTRTPRVLLDLFTVFFLLSFFSSPMRFFGAAGLVSSFLGILVGGSLGALKIYHGLTEGWAGFHAYEIGSRPLFLLAILFILVGVQFLMMGLLGEMIMRTYYEASRKPPYYIRKVLP